MSSQDTAWMDAGWLHLATAVAATTSGREHLERERLEAADAGQDATVARLDSALARGELLMSAASARDAELRNRHGALHRVRDVRRLGSR
ncbi:hypothetical protein AB2L27_17435 [Kineococcus sp. LSe6-4]|uniref:Uncharacterized protein n=1 Tax=Kineococcus halophytocola TaxID=3234027 RepID=A0ABV4H4Q1_9ACTN